MPGTLTIKPIQASFSHKKESLFSKMDPYCEILLGGQRVTSSICHSGGRHPYWSDIFTLKSNNEPVLYINIKDKDALSHDDNLGMTQVDLKNVTSFLSGPQWYPVMGKHGLKGEVLLEITYNSGMQTYTQPTPIYPGTPIQTGFPTQVLTGIPASIPTTSPITQAPIMLYPTQGYPPIQPMTGYPNINQPIVSYPQGQPVVTQVTYPNTHPMIVQQPINTAYTQQPLVTGMQGYQPQHTYQTQGYAPTMGGYGGIYYK